MSQLEALAKDDSSKASVRREGAEAALEVWHRALNGSRSAKDAWQKLQIDGNPFALEVVNMEREEP